MPIILLFISIFVSLNAWSYPEFIGYKYSSCLTCHFNGNGSGPLNDYGRALWSAEIAGRLFSGNKTDDELGESSGFIGKTPLPWWIRPGLKTRELMIRNNPGPKSSVNKQITMQREVNLAIFLDPDQKYAFVGSYGYIPPKRDPLEETVDWISREHYFRWQRTDDHWIYVGMMDKVYGIRLVDHTAFSRQNTGLSQSDQSEGVISQLIKTNWEWSAGIFIGNFNKNIQYRQKGFSTVFEYEVVPNLRLGASYLNSSSDHMKNQRMALHSRYGFGYGSSLLFELGLVDNTPKGTASDELTRGYYMYAEAMQRIIRGYHLYMTAQTAKSDVKTPDPDSVRTSFGFLSFPMARVELRLEFQNSWQWASSAAVNDDSWAMLGQAHLSL